MKKKRKKKKKHYSKTIIIAISKGLYHTTKFVLSIPFYILQGIITLRKKIEEKTTKQHIKKRRAKIKATKEPLQEEKTRDGTLQEWETMIQTKKGNIGIIIGARGTGKSALGLRILENIKAEGTRKKLYTIGFDNEELPTWITNIETEDNIPNNSHLLIDEGGILYNARNNNNKANKLLSNLLLIARHKNISILFITQNSANLEINTLRQADYLLLKPSSLLQQEFERKIIRELYKKKKKEFNAYKNKKGITYLHSQEYQGMITNKLPSFWNENISTNWKDKDYNTTKHKKGKS